MSKLAWALLALLVFSNASWWFAERRPVPLAPAVSGAESGAERARIAELELEVEGLRASAAEAALLERTEPARPVVSQEPEPERAVRTSRRSEMVATQQEWVRAALQTADAGQRAAALAAVRAALMGNDPVAIEAALRAIARIRELDYDKASMRPLVLPMLEHADGAVRSAALYALLNTVAMPEDGTLLLSMVRDPAPEVRARMAHVLMKFGRGEVRGEVAEAVAALFDDPDPEVRRGVQTGLWGARVDPSVEQRFLELCEEPGQRHDAIYFGLSTFADKSPAVVAALVAAIDDPNPEVAERARWGLGHGVLEESRAAVADAFVRLLETRGDPGLRSECLDRIEACGDHRQVGALQAFAARPLLDDATRERVAQLIPVLASR